VEVELAMAASGEGDWRLTAMSGGREIGIVERVKNG
jgi:hypothetical protein